MIIKEFSTSQFAGLNNKSFEFDKGLNVVLGPNEAGKSSMVNGIVATLFNRIKVGDLKKDDIEFKERYLPHPHKDSADGKVVLSCDSGDYLLEKEWGKSPSIKLICPDGSIIKDETKINDLLVEVLKFGESTYKKIVFSRQEDLKDALNLITNDESTIYELGGLLRKTVMELDGVSLEAFESKLEQEIDDIYKRWNIEKEYPENNRGINNPFKKGYGKLVGSYYAKETINALMKETSLKEKELEFAYTTMKEYEEKLSEVKIRKLSMEAVEADIRKRGSIQVEYDNLKTKIDNLKEVYSKWPDLEKHVIDLKDQIQTLQDRLEQLEKEKDLVNSDSAKKALEDKIKRAKDINSVIVKLNCELKNIPKVEDKDIIALEDASREVERLQTLLSGGNLSGQIIRIPEGMDLFVKGIEGEREYLEEGSAFSSKGMVTIGSSAGLEIKIAPGKQNIEELNVKLNEESLKLVDILAALKLESIEEAKVANKKISRIISDLEHNQASLEYVLDGVILKDLEDQLKDITPIGDIRDIEDIKSDIDDVNNSLLQRKIELSISETELRSFKDSYDQNSDVLERIIQLSVDFNERDKELIKLKELPTEFESIDQYFEDLGNLRSKYDEYNKLYYSERDFYLSLEKDLPETSYEELAKEYYSSVKEYDRLLSKGKALLRIKDAFIKTKERLDSGSNTDLLNSISKYLRILTRGSYYISNLDDQLNFNLLNSKEIDVPFNILSTGTKDSVSLALRLSLVEALYSDSNGVIVLDDCLVDLDPERRSLAIDMIKEFSNKHQVIFTTCNPSTATDLSERIINL